MDDQQKNEVESGQAQEAMMINAQAAADHQPSTPDAARVRQAVAASEETASSSSPPTKEKVPTVGPGQVYPAQNTSGPSLVFALGTLGYDFGSEARRDSIAQHMASPDNPAPNPQDPTQLLAYLEANPDQAAAVTWTVSLDGTSIYGILPHGPFAATAYERLRQFLGEQLSEGVERVSIAGVIIGQARLMSGQTVPVIWPELRCMYSWTTAALIKAVCGQPPAKSAQAQDHEAYARKTQAVANFLERVYHELRNLGLTPQARAINHTATNAMNVEKIFEAALKENMELDTIEVERSPICRLDSDCWDVKLTFFNPGKVLEQARKVYRFTVDVSDVCPVMVGNVRAWSMR